MIGTLFQTLAKQLEYEDDWLTIIVMVAVFVALSAFCFWLFIWAVATLFHYQIAFTFINWLACQCLFSGVNTVKS